MAAFRKVDRFRSWRGRVLISPESLIPLMVLTHLSLNALFGSGGDGSIGYRNDRYAFTVRHVVLECTTRLDNVVGGFDRQPSLAILVDK